MHTAAAHVLLCKVYICFILLLDLVAVCLCVVAGFFFYLSFDIFAVCYPSFIFFILQKDQILQYDRNANFNGVDIFRTAAL